MKTHQKLIIILAAMFAIALISPAAWAKKDQPPPPPSSCSLTGTWTGDAEGDLAWLAIHTSTDGIKGEMLMNWVYIDLFGDEQSYEMAPGHGVWELIDSDTGTYRYTWYSQVKSIVIAPEQSQIFQIRVYGTAQMQGCDDVVIEYTFEIHQGYDETGEPVWVNFDYGEAYETRIKVYSPELQ